MMFDKATHNPSFVDVAPVRRLGPGPGLAEKEDTWTNGQLY